MGVGELKGELQINLLKDKSSGKERVRQIHWEAWFCGKENSSSISLRTHHHKLAPSQVCSLNWCLLVVPPSTEKNPQTMMLQLTVFPCNWQKQEKKKKKNIHVNSVQPWSQKINSKDQDTRKLISILVIKQTSKKNYTHILWGNKAPSSRTSRNNSQLRPMQIWAITFIRLKKKNLKNIS